MCHVQSHSMGAFNLTNNSSLNSRNFRVSNRTGFPFLLGHNFRQDLIDKMLKDHDKVAALSAVGRFMQRSLKCFHDYCWETLP